MTTQRDWRLYLADMQEFASRAVGYCAGLSREQFECDQLTQQLAAIQSDGELQP